MGKIQALTEKDFKQKVFAEALELVGCEIQEDKLLMLFNKYAKAKSICTKHRLLREELFVTPEKDLFGDDLHTPIKNKLKSLEKIW